MKENTLLGNFYYLRSLKQVMMYRTIAYISGLILIVGLFITISDQTNKAMFDLFYEFVVLTTFTSTFLWLKRKLLFIGLIFYLFSFNIDLLFNPLIRTGLDFLSETLYWIGTVFNGIGFVFLLLGFWDKINNKPWNRLDLRLNTILIIIFLFSGLTQTVIRLI